MAAIHPDALIRAGNHVGTLSAENKPLTFRLEVRGLLSGIDRRQTVRSCARVLKKYDLKIHLLYKLQVLPDHVKKRTTAPI